MTDKAIIESVEPVILNHDSYVRICVRYQIDSVGEWTVDYIIKNTIDPEANDYLVVINTIKSELVRLVDLRTSYTDTMKSKEGGYFDVAGDFHPST